jgi:hypothetical protein
MEESIDGGVIVDDSTWEHIDEVGSGEKRLIPKFKRHMSMSKKS